MPAQDIPDHTLSFEVLANALKAKSSSIRMCAFMLLAHYNDSRVAELLLRATKKDRGLNLVWLIIRIMRYCTGTNVLPALLYAMKRHNNARVRQAAAEVLGEFDDPHVGLALEKALKDRKRAVRRAASASLAIFNGVEHNYSVPKEYGKPKPVPTLPSLIDEEVTSLIDKLQDGNHSMHRHITNRLMELDKAEVIPALIEILPALKRKPYRPQINGEILALLYRLYHDEKGQTFTSALTLDTFFNYPLYLIALEQLAVNGEWRHMATCSHFSYRNKLPRNRVELDWALNALEKTYEYQKKNESEFLCMQHLARFSRQTRSLTEYLGCRHCGETILSDKIDQVILALDNSMTVPSLRKGNRLVVKYQSNNSTLCDFDIVEIVDCSEHDLESFLITIGNDADVFRTRRYPDMVCRVRMSVSAGTIRRLEAFFGEVAT